MKGILNGIINSKITNVEKEYEGFEVDTEKTEYSEATIKPDGTTLVKIYYKRIKKEITFDTDGGSTIEGIEIKYGDVLPKDIAPTKQGYVFDGWTLDGEDFNEETSITDNIKLKAKWLARNDTSYKVNYYKEDLNGNYDEENPNDIDNKTGTTDTKVKQENIEKTIRYYLK